MLSSPLVKEETINPDHAALKARLFQRHGADVGQMVFDSAMNRFRLEDARHVELVTELTANHAQTSALSKAAGERQQKAQTRIAATYTAYLALLDEEAKTSALEESAIAPLRARSGEIQRAMRTITLPRLNERELQDVSLYNSVNAELLRKAAPADEVHAGRQ
jgi:HSP90 family molecular chaperone